MYPITPIVLLTSLMASVEAASQTLRPVMNATTPISSTVEVVWTTQVVTAFKTFCPSPTSWVLNKVTYTATRSEWVTVTDCPKLCTVSYKTGPTPTIVPIGAPKYGNKTVPVMPVVSSMNSTMTAVPVITPKVCPCATATGRVNQSQAPCACTTLTAIPSSIYPATTKGSGYQVPNQGYNGTVPAVPNTPSASSKPLKTAASNMQTTITFTSGKPGSTKTTSVKTETTSSIDSPKGTAKTTTPAQPSSVVASGATSSFVAPIAALFAAGGVAVYLL